MNHSRNLNHIWKEFLKDIKDPEHVGALTDLTQDKAQGHYVYA